MTMINPTEPQGLRPNLPSVSLVRNQQVQFTPKLLFEEDGTKCVTNGFFWKSATIELDIGQLLPVEYLNKDDKEADTAGILFYCVSKHLESLLLPAAHNPARKVYIQFFQQVDSTGSLINLEASNHGWPCKVLVHKHLFKLLELALPIGFSFDLTLSNVNISPAQAGTDAEANTSHKKTSVPDIRTFNFYPSLYGDCVPIVNPSMLDNYSHSCTTVMFEKKQESYSVLRNSLIELDLLGENIDQTYEATVSLKLMKEKKNTVYLNSSCFCKKNVAKNLCWDLISMNKKMLENKLEPDVTIVLPETGIKKKGYKVILEASSPVFKNMLDEKKWLNNEPDVLNLENMSEESVNALLTFLHTGDVTAMTKCPSVAVELLIASNRYQVDVLEVQVSCMLLEKPDNWFFQDLDAANNLYHFADCFDSMNLHKKKAKRILEKCSPELLRRNNYQ